MRLAVAATFLALCVALAAGCGSEPKSAAPNGAAKSRALRGSPPALASLHSQGSQLLGGGPAAFSRRIAQLKGHPVVVNKWASWCGPCRAEFPVFQKVSVAQGRRVAFLGVNSSDNDADAMTFLKQFPVSYPSYKDPDLKIAQVFHGVGAFPTTVFYDRSGQLAFVHQGPYFNARKLIQDIQRYAG